MKLNLTTAFRRAEEWFRRSFARWLDKTPPVAPAEDTPPIASTPALSNRPPKRDIEHVEESGRWYFKRDILDRLDEYFRYVGRLKKHDPDAYDLYTKIGGVITNAGARERHFSTQLESWNGIENLPAFALATWPEKLDDDEDQKERGRINVKLCYAVKYKDPLFCAVPPGAVVYRCVLFYAKRDEKDVEVPIQYPVAVMPDGKVQLLRQYEAVTQIIRHRHSRKDSGGNRDKASSIVHWRPVWPSMLVELASDNKKTPEQIALFNFYYTMNMVGAGTTDVLVRCTNKKGLTAAFSIDLLRTPYFFKDRERVVTETGATRRIFHIVRTHRRSTGEYVKSHFRGLRDFRWGDYQIQISMPGKHHSDITNFTAGAIETDEKELGGTIGLSEAASLIDSHLRSGKTIAEINQGAAA